MNVIETYLYNRLQEILTENNFSNEKDWMESCFWHQYHWIETARRADQHEKLAYYAAATCLEMFSKKWIIDYKNNYCETYPGIFEL